MRQGDSIKVQRARSTVEQEMTDPPYMSVGLPIMPHLPGAEEITISKPQLRVGAVTRRHYLVFRVGRRSSLFFGRYIEVNYILRRFGEVLCHKIRLTGRVSHAVRGRSTGQYEPRPAPRALACGHILFAVSHHDRVAKINAVFLSSLQEQSRPRFPAGTTG